MTIAPGDARDRRPQPMAALATLVMTAIVAWGAFAFGAVYEWAYQPLAIVSAVCGVAAMAVPGGPSLRRLGLMPLTLAWCLLLGAIALQLVPLPWSVAARVSPPLRGVVDQIEPAAAAGLQQTHPLSIAPERTRAGLGLIAAFAILGLGSARLFSIVGTRRAARAIAFTGLALAIVGLVQYPLYAGRIYGFWTPVEGRNPFGPFVNKNHFAGWMLMGLPLLLGLTAAGVSRVRFTTTSVRERVLWLSSPQGGRTLLWIAMALLLALSVLLSRSRSGISLMAIAVAAIVLRTMKRSGGTRRGIPLAVVGAVLAFAIAGWLAFDLLSARFGEATLGDVNDRTGAWLDAIHIAARFPIAGTGFNTYGIATVFFQEHDLKWHYMEAHNDYLQLAAEGGLLLSIPALVCVVAFAALVRRRFAEETSLSTSWIRFGAVVGLAAVALQDLVDFSLQMPGNAALFAVLCGIALHRTPERQTRAALGRIEG